MDPRPHSFRSISPSDPDRVAPAAHGLRHACVFPQSRLGPVGPVDTDKAFSARSAEFVGLPVDESPYPGGGVG